MTRRLSVFAVVVIAVVAVGGVAFASWSAGGTGNAYGRAQTLPAGGTPTVTKSGRDLTVTWAQTTVNGTDLGTMAGGGYLITRYASGSGTPISPGSACNATQTGSGASLNCIETSLATGRWVYTVKPALGAWRGPQSANSNTIAVAPNAPSSVSLTNGGGTGNAYINATNKASLNFNVAVPSTSLSSDTITVSLTDGTTTVTRTAQPSVDGATTMSVNGVNGATLNDGSVTASAISTSSYGDASGSVSTTITKDTATPAAATSIALANGGGTGSAYVNSANKSSINVTVTMPASASAADTLSVTATDVGAAHTVTRSASSRNGAGTVSVTGLDLTSLNDGTVTFAVAVTDAAGNASGSVTSTSTKDTAVATVDTTKLMATDNSNVQADVIVGAAGAGEANATVSLSETAPLPGGPYTGTVAAGGTFSVAVAAVPGTSLAPVTVSYSITQTDLAGNTSGAVNFSYSDRQ